MKAYIDAGITIIIYLVCLNSENINGNEYYLKPFQMNLILQLPGQQIPIHYDTPFFNGATRYNFPKWLLIVMEHSKLFENRRIPQVQIVTYIHSNSDPNRGGDFILYPNGITKHETLFQALPRRAIFADGSLYAHGTTILYPNTSNIISLNKDNESYLKYIKELNVWRLHYNNNSNTYSDFKWNELRASIAMRAWCFNNKSDADSFDPHKLSNDFNMDDILHALKMDISSKLGKSMESLNAMKPFDLGMLMIQTYIKYPYKGIIFKYNYCAVFKPLKVRFPSFIRFQNLVKTLLNCD